MVLYCNDATTFWWVIGDDYVFEFWPFHLTFQAPVRLK